ncbi:hypothetical protein BC835DRAFT_1398128 [Cytidiella melzeri]|nr:hypothetical protein BC835DRAFT_1398128 [Cytidiella melzeri]
MQTGAFTNPLRLVPHVVKFEVNIDESGETFHVQQVPKQRKGYSSCRRPPHQAAASYFCQSLLSSLSLPPLTTPPSSAPWPNALEQQCQFFLRTNSYRTQLLPATAIYETNFLLLGRGMLQAEQDAAGIFILGSHLNSACTPNLSKT